VAAKVDTGARTSALHVSAASPWPAEERASALDVVLPRLGPRKEPRAIRVSVAEWVEIRDTSGRRERRPVIETVLEIGPFRRKVRLSLTHRGDMRYPMLVGRSALSPGILVDPAARFLLGRLPPPPRARTTRRREEALKS
jgi:ribosomal protein S6--L-glutamate ligase